jgi:large subunit ribosomal protein L28
MDKLFSFLLVIVAITQATAFMGTPVISQRQVVTRNNGASSMEMRARVCDLLGKEPNRQARVVTFSHKRIKKVQHVNLQSKRFFSENLDRKVKLRLSTKGIKTVNKLGGIDAAAKKFKVDLKKF